MADNPEVDKLQTRIKELEEQIEEEREEHEWDLKASQETNAQTIKKLEEEIARLQKAPGAVKPGKASGDIVSTGASSHVDMLTQRALLAERRVAELQEELKRARNMAPPPPQKGGDALLRQRAEDAERERDELRREKRALERTLEEKNTSMERARKELDQGKQIKKELETLRSELAARDKELQAARTDSAGSIEEKEQKVRELAQELNELAGVEAERDALAGELEQLRTTLADRQQTIEQLQAAREQEAGAQELELSRRAAEAEAEAGRLRQEMAQMQVASGQMMEQRERETERLKSDLKEATDQHTLVNEQVASLNRELGRLRDELAVTASERDEMVEQMRALRERETVVSRPPEKPADEAGAVLPPAGPDLFQDRTQKAPSPRGADPGGGAPVDQAPPASAEPGAATGAETLQEVDEASMPVVTGEVVEHAMEKAEDLFLEDETTKKTERVRFAKGSTEQAEVPPPPGEGSPAEDEIPPPAVESVEEPPAATQQAEAAVAEEDLPEAEIVPDDVAADARPAGDPGTSDPGSRPDAPPPVSAPPPSEAATQPDGSPFQERSPAARVPGGGPGSGKAGGRGGLLLKALLIGVIFGGVIISALHFFPKWFGPGDEAEISADPQDVDSASADAGTGARIAAPDGGEQAAPPADQPGADGQPAADAPGPEQSDEPEAGQPEPADDTPALQDFEMTPAIRKIRAQGRRLLKRKKYRKATRFLEKKMQDHPGDPVLHYLAGRSLFRLHKVGASLDELERAVELDPSFADAYFELGGVYLKARQRAKACQAMKRFVELESGTKRARGVQGNIRLLKCR